MEPASWMLPPFLTHSWALASGEVGLAQFIMLTGAPLPGVPWTVAQRDWFLFHLICFPAAGGGAAEEDAGGAEDEDGGGGGLEVLEGGGVTPPTYHTDRQH